MQSESLCLYAFFSLGAFPDAFKFQEHLKKLREMIQESTLRELLKTCVNPNVGCSDVFKAVVGSSNYYSVPIQVILLAEWLTVGGVSLARSPHKGTFLKW